MRNFRVGLLLIFFILFLSACARAGEFKIIDARVQPGKIGTTGEAYIIISNATDTSVRISVKAHSLNGGCRTVFERRKLTEKFYIKCATSSAVI